MYRLARAILALTPLASAFADGITVEHRLDSGPMPGSSRPVACDGDLVVTGGHGAVRVFDLASGQLVRELQYQWTFPDSHHLEEFGRVVDIDGDLVVVGAPSDEHGAAFVYRVSTGQLVSKLWPEAPFLGDKFGACVAIEGGIVLVGAPDDNTTAVWAGAVHVFDATTGTRLAKVVVPTGRDEHFGAAVAADGGRFLVGAPKAEPDPAGSRGAAYLFDLATLQLLQELRVTDASGSKGFGYAVALEGDRALVGDPLFGQTYRGAAHLFDLGAGTSVRLKAGEVIAGNAFGAEVTLAGGVGVVGARDADDSGVIYIFDSAGRRVTSFDPPDGAAGDFFGMELGAAGSNLVVSGELEQPYVLSLFTSAGQSYCGPANLNSTGAPGVMDALGSSRVGEEYLWLSATQLPAAAPTMFLTSRVQGFSSRPGSQGNLCLDAVGAYADQLVGAAEGAAMISLDLSTTPTPGGPVPIQAGETWHFQAWYRDANPGPTSNFTDAVSVTFH